MPVERSSVPATLLGLPGLVALELREGCRNLADQRRLEKQLRRYALHWPTLADCQRGYQDFAAYCHSRGLGLLDALIGATAVLFSWKFAGSTAV